MRRLDSIATTLLDFHNAQIRWDFSGYSSCMVLIIIPCVRSGQRGLHLSGNESIDVEERRWVASLYGPRSFMRVSQPIWNTI